MIKKISALYVLVRFIELKSNSSTFDLIEGHLECGRHVVILGCLCKAERRVRHICKIEKVELRAVTHVRKEWIPR